MPREIIHKISSDKNIQSAGNIELVHSGEDYFLVYEILFQKLKMKYICKLIFLKTI